MTATRTSKKGLSSAAVNGIAFDQDNLGSAEVVEIAQINIDPEYQRGLRHDLVNEISRDYNMVKAGPILVSERDDGSLWAVDGQHRMVGAQNAGETEIFAHVVHGLSQAQEAELRLARNNRKSDTMQEKFRSRLTMGDQKAHQMVEVVRQQGTEINMTPLSYKGINAISTLEAIYDVDGTGVWLARTIRFIKEAVGVESLNPDTLSASMMKAVAWFIDRHIDSKEASWNEMVERVGAAGVEDIRRKAVSHKAANGGPMWINYYRSLVELWNFRRSEKNKILWKTTGSLQQLGSDSTPTALARQGKTIGGHRVDGGGDG
jgi:hypothetical protein